MVTEKFKIHRNIVNKNIKSGWEIKLEQQIMNLQNVKHQNCCE